MKSLKSIQFIVIAILLLVFTASVNAQTIYNITNVSKSVKSLKTGDWVDYNVVLNSGTVELDAKYDIVTLNGKRAIFKTISKVEADGELNSWTSYYNGEKYTLSMAKLTSGNIFMISSITKPGTIYVHTLE
jgi:hypothetical protein